MRRATSRTGQWRRRACVRSGPAPSSRARLNGRRACGKRARRSHLDALSPPASFHYLNRSPSLNRPVLLTTLFCFEISELLWEKRGVDAASVRKQLLLRYSPLTADSGITGVVHNRDSSALYNTA